MTAWTEQQLIEIWNEALDDVLDLVADVDDDQWRAPTPCPGWSVGDVVAHLVDVEGLLAGEPRPDHEPDWANLPHITGDFGRFTEVGVDFRREQPRQSVVDELRSVTPKRRGQLDDTPDGQEVVGPFGNTTTMDRLLRIRTLDIWMHEQDIRTALDRPGDLATRPARVSLEQIERALPIVWARNCKAPAGATARVTVTEPGLSADMAAVVGDDGKGALTAPPEESTVHLTLTWPDLVALSAGRVDPSDAALRERLTLAGDHDLAEALLHQLSITP